MSDRDSLLEKWVTQPPAPPNIQYLRDAERLAALDRLGNRGSVLDLASEATLTQSLDADAVTRVDFSESASEHASRTLGTHVDEYAVVEPTTPTLPFPDDAFDAAVSLGPFDWKFLDVEALLAEVHRVVKPDGLFVFSVPTPRSPYYGDFRNRFYEPEDLLGLVSPDWMVSGRDLLFQYPSPVHGLVTALPDPLQEPFVDVAWWLSELFGSRGLWDRASYVVLAVRPLDYRGYLDSALECLFRPTDETGFWDPEAGTFARAFDYELVDGEPTWTLDDSTQYRYAPFALMGVLRWRVSPLGTDRYDRQIERALAYFADRVADDATLGSMPNYGLGPLVMAFAIAGDVFDDESYTDTAYTIYEHTADCEFRNSEDSLLPFGWSYLYESTADERVRNSIEEALPALNAHLTRAGLFEFENPTSRRHQNQMYALWGLCRAIEVTGQTGYLQTAERVIEYTIEHRMREDGAFIWEDVPAATELKTELGRRLGRRNRPPHWAFLYECHQTFFVNAVQAYYDAGGTNEYETAVRRAMEWIYGTNVHGRDLVELSGIGVPMRFTTVSGRMDAPADQTYKGSYEIGSYVMALTALLTDRDVPDETHSGDRGRRELATHH